MNGGKSPRENNHPVRHGALAAASTSSADREHVLHRDYESRSCTVLRIAGTFKYATDPTTEVLSSAYADEPVQLWTPGDPVPAEFVEAANNPNWIVCAHGARFEDAIERYVLHPRIGWPTFPVEKQVCTQAMALAVGLPARLSLAAIALELSNRKDAAGERLMHQTSKPRRPHKDEDPTKVYWFEDAGRLQRLNEYCRQDVAVERELFTRLPPLSASEQALWELSSRINTRGFHVDRAFAQAARKIAEAAAPHRDHQRRRHRHFTSGSLAFVAARTWVAVSTIWAARPSKSSSKLMIYLHKSDVP
jgi:DNA polymerase